MEKAIIQRVGWAKRANASLAFSAAQHINARIFLTLLGCTSLPNLQVSILGAGWLGIKHGTNFPRVSNE